MESHKRILGILYIISGFLHLVGMIFMSVLFALIFPLAFEHAHIENQWILVWIVPFLRVIAFTIILLIAIPSLIGGLGMLYEKKWAFTLVLVLGCFKLFWFPIGTALGVYTIWAYSEFHKTLSPKSV